MGAIFNKLPVEDTRKSWKQFQPVCPAERYAGLKANLDLSQAEPLVRC